MMNKIYRDLTTNVRKIYKTNVITVANFFHHSLNYSEMTALLSKYKGNHSKIKEDLYNYIITHESKNKKIQSEIQNPLLEGFLNDFDDVFINGVKTNQTFENQDVLELRNLAREFELRKIMRQNKDNGSVSVPDDISLSSFLRAVIELGHYTKYSFIIKILKDSGFKIEKFIQDEETGRAQNKSVIDELCTNLNKKAINGKIEKVIGRSLEIEQLTNILKKAKKNNPVLVGLPGTGKTAIVEGLAQKIVNGEVPDALKKAVIYELRIMDIVKGTSFRGQFEQKMSDLLSEFQERESENELPILFIDELHTIMGAGSSGNGGLDFSNIIKPALARGELRTIGATTTDEWFKFIKENPALDRRFIPVTVKEPSVEDSILILNGSLPYYEKNHNVKYEKGSVERAIELSQQFIVDNALPDKAFDLIDYAGAMCAVKNKKEVSIEDIEYALARSKNVDLDSIITSRRDKIKPLAPEIKKVIFGQDNAVDKVCQVVEKSIAGLNSLDKPYGAFLFTGPTGTGKTELAKQIAKAMKSSYIRLDMSEFKESHTVSKLIGSPAGYVGYGDSSSLVKEVSQNPRIVILLDEIEKAHPDVIKLFLQIMDYGKLTDSKGKEINFRNALIIMTSNAGVNSNSSQVIGIMNNSEKSNINKNEINNYFPPEFRARLTGNGPVEFKPLEKTSLEKIVLKYIDEIQKERLDKLHIKLSLSKEALNQLVELGLSKQLGARPIKDSIENNIVEQLTPLVLFGKLKGLKQTEEISVQFKDSKFILDF